MKSQLPVSTKITIFLITAIVFCTVLFGGLYLIWILYSWVMPQIYPSGPVNIITPSYWLFIGMWFLIAFIGRLIFGGKNKK